MPEPDHSARTAAPMALRAAAIVVLVEAVAVLVYAVIDAAHIDSSRLELGLAATGFFVICALALGWCAWGLLNLKRVARGPVLFCELAMLGLAWNAYGAGRILLPVLMVVGALAVLAGLLHPRSIAALEEAEDEGRD